MNPIVRLAPDFCADPTNAYTLPAPYYTDAGVFEREKERIFANSWVCVGHRSEVAENNAYITREFIGESIIIVRGRDAELRAFYNVCPHRGHQLLQGDGKARNVITCPYHAWTFKLDGELAHARNCDQVADFDKANSSLVQLRVEEYAGFIFVNMNQDAGPVAEQLPGLEARLRQACPVVDDLHLAARFVSQTPANWKSIVDNYLECYHCAPAHPGFSDSVDVGQYSHSLHGNWSLQYGVAKPSEKSFKFDESVKDPSFAGFWAWPCTMFNAPPGGNFMTVIYEFPVSAEVTLQHYDIYFLNQDLTADQQSLIEWYRNVFRPEDLRLVESVQKGLKSRGYRGQGRIMVDHQRSGLSEHGIAHFHHLVAQQHQD
ncbi:aromatic ring-hydroxylating dioxygenase subunit alpha [Metapseudomonas resinovorans]|uniref:Carnitine monooxygenase oxygenase subunit n=1 Tax=Metapseudomonas resinovorans NBRC 106553 TaxID=1245471 RepID=S6AZV0_METRE|nr:ring-hydroxylating oxygenase subunit alpha [Pseudomonas resinovorans]BAN50451.1 putative Rieske iron-sulfur protein [Pseudomonas resinovorans NBRC 106553]